MQYGNTVVPKLDDNMVTLKYRFHAPTNKDIVFRSFQTKSGLKCFCAFIDGMVNGEVINEFIIRPLIMYDKDEIDPANIIQIHTIDDSDKINESINGILAGDTAVFFDGMEKAFICETKGFQTRSISTPVTENTIKGSQEAFTEAIRSSTSQIRRIIKSSNLITEFITIGSINNNSCAIMYLEDIVNKKLVDEVKKRLTSIKGDFIMGSGMVEQLIEDSPLSIFPSLMSTERPDRAAHYISSGRVAILVDGVPFVLIAPVTISLLLDSPEGSSQRWINGTFERLIRIFALFCATMISGVYLALILFHRDMLPTTLLGAIMKASTNVPFPIIVEIILMELFFDLVREAGLRIPHMLGNTLSIVGALILGQSAVEANLVSPVSLIIVALSGVGGAALPDFDLSSSLRVVKLIVIIMGSVLGFLGIAVALAVFITVLSNQNSFGVPMLSMQGIRWGASTPLFIQLPLWKQERRAEELGTKKPISAPKISRSWTQEEGGE